MNEIFKKWLKELGVNDATLETIFAEGADPAAIEALYPAISTANRAKWEQVLASDGKFTETFTARGHASGKATALQGIKNDLVKTLGIQLDPNTDEFKDNEKFAAALKSMFDKKGTEGGNPKTDEILKQKEAEFQTMLQNAIQKERETLAAQEAQKLQSVRNDMGFKNNLVLFGMGKTLKGGLGIDVLLPAIEAKAKSYKWEYDENGQPVKVFDTEGNPIDNGRGDGHLSPSDILSKIYEPFIDTAAADGQQQQQRQQDNKQGTLSSMQAEMGAFRD